MSAQAYFPVRTADPEDLGFLWDMLYEAACWNPDQRPPREEVLSDPHNALYLEDWGRPGDAGVVALDPDRDRRIGAAWYRLMSPERPGHGFVEASTPEIAIAVDAEYRNRGVGKVLLDALMDAASSEGFEALSLSVEQDNLAAIRLYERSGFVKLFLGEDAWTMKAELSGRAGDGA